MRRILVLLLACGYFPSFPSVFAEQPETVQFLNSGKIPSTNLPFSEAVRVDNMLYLSGQIGIAPGTRKLVPGGLKEEARQTMYGEHQALSRGPRLYNARPREVYCDAC